MDEMVERQIERRRERGKTDLARIVNRGNHPIYSTFEVTSRSDRTYRVRIRDLEARHNTCTCPDYRTNLIGTCKHIEGVLIKLRERYGDELGTLAADRPELTQIYLRHAREVTVRVSQPLPETGPLRELLERYFDPEGVLQGPVRHTLPALLHDLDALPDEARATVDVSNQVTEHLALLRDRASVARQRAWFEEQVERGNRSLDLLSTPLYPYQEEGAMHLAFGRRAMLADDMGSARRCRPLPRQCCCASCATSSACSSSAPPRSSTSGRARWSASRASRRR